MRASSRALVHKQVDSGDLVGIGDIAERIGQPKAVVSNWTRRYKDFPDPVARVSGGMVFLWAEVDTWLGPPTAIRRPPGAPSTDARPRGRPRKHQGEPQ